MLRVTEMPAGWDPLLLLLPLLLLPLHLLQLPLQPQCL
jgi:hypothetical protein